MAPKKRQRRKEEGQGDDAAHPPSRQKPGDNAADSFDPDGSLNVARGGPKRADATSKKDEDHDHDAILEQLSESQKLQVGKHLFGNQGHLAVLRRQTLRRDDASSSRWLNKNLSETQKHHLQHRSNRKSTAILQQYETKRLRAAVSAATAVDILQDGDDGVGLLEAETDMERTSAVTQTQLKRHHLDAETARNIFDLQLSSPYGLEYDRSGRYAVLYGKRNGHVAVMDNAQQSLVTEFHVGRNEIVRDATFLHNFTLHAVAQRNHVYIYDHTGAEIHCLPDHNDPIKLQFLPYHWLLASIGRTGYLKYQDVSTGQVVSSEQHRTKLGAPTALRQNPANAVLHAGHSNGTVTLWSPAQSTYLAKLQCHKHGAAVTALAVDLSGRTMVTGGMDGQVRIWDLRMFTDRLNNSSYYTVDRSPPTSLDISQRNLLAVGHGGHVTVWSADALQQRKVAAPYLHHRLGVAGDNAARAPVETVRFRHFQDVCGLGHGNGISSIVVPGAGEPALDTAEYNLNPAQDVKQRREAEVRALLDKLSPDMIGLDADAVGGMEASDPASRLEQEQDNEQEESSAAAALANQKKKKQKTKKRGRSKIQTKLRRKRQNIIDQNVLQLRAAKEKEDKEKQQAQQQQQQETGANDDNSKNESVGKKEAPAALKRFF